MIHVGRVVYVVQECYETLLTSKEVMIAKVLQFMLEAPQECTLWLNSLKAKFLSGLGGGGGRRAQAWH